MSPKVAFLTGRRLNLSSYIRHELRGCPTNHSINSGNVYEELKACQKFLKTVLFFTNMIQFKID